MGVGFSGFITNSVGLCAAVVFAFVAAVWVLRHWRLAAVAALAPLPGALLFASIVPPAGGFAGLSLATGWATSLFMAHRIATAATGEAGPHAWKSARRFNEYLAAATASVLILPAIGEALSGSLTFLVVAAGSVAAVVPAWAAVAFAAPRITFDEDFVTASNRSREWRARLAAWLVPLAHRPHGSSVAGVALVLAAIAILSGRQPRVPADIAAWPLVLPALLSASVFAYVVLREWRRCLAVVACMALASLSGIWAAARGGIDFNAANLAVLFSAAAIGFALQLCVAFAAAGDPATEEEVAVASERAIESETFPVIVTASVAIAAAGLSLWASPSAWLTFAATVAASAAFAAAFQPAFAIVLEALRPRRETIRARYRLR